MSPCARISLRLWPAQNARPWAAITTTRAVGSLATASIAACMAANMASLSTLKALGVLSIKVCTPRPSRACNRIASAASDIGQHPDMRLHAAPQRAQVVAAFKAGDDALVGVAAGHVLDAVRDPGVVLLHQPHLAQIVFAVRIKTG